MIALTALSDLTQWDFDDIIDVRSPSEYAEDHIPGAINMPVLSDAQRAVVGTIYVQESRFKARKVGASLIARNAADHIETHMADKPGGWRPLVHCWRGGQRSGSFASILTQIGWRAEVLEGGYKSYRRLVVQALYDQPLAHRIVLIDGNTGTAKTKVLHLLARAGAQILDLEGLAAHRGSIFGGRDGGQPSQKMLESRLAQALQALDPHQPVFVEAESNKVGNILIPESLWKSMLAAPRITLSAPLTARAAFLLRSYGDLVEDRDLLKQRICKLRYYHSKEQLAEWLDMAETARFHDLAASLMARHYDPSYAKTYARRDRQELGQIFLPALDDDTLAALAVPQILALAQQAGRSGA